MFTIKTHCRDSYVGTAGGSPAPTPPMRPRLGRLASRSRGYIGAASGADDRNNNERIL